MTDEDRDTASEAPARSDESRSNESTELTRRPDGAVRVWLVERTYSDDEQNIIILVYATPDGSRSFRKERALTSFSDARETTAAVWADPENLSAVAPDRREQYATEAERMRASNDPTDVI